MYCVFALGFVYCFVLHFMFCITHWGLGVFQKRVWAFKSEFFKFIMITISSNIWVDILCGISKVPFEIPHKLSYPYTKNVYFIQRWQFKSHWDILNWILRNKLQWNFNQNSYISIKENALQNGGHLYWPQCVKSSNPNHEQSVGFSFAIILEIL